MSTLQGTFSNKATVQSTTVQKTFDLVSNIKFKQTSSSKLFSSHLNKREVTAEFQWRKELISGYDPSRDEQ